MKRSVAGIFVLSLLLTLSAAVHQERRPDDFTLQQANELFEQARAALKERRYEDAIAGFRRIYDGFPTERIGALSAYNIACAFSVTKKKADAVEWLQKAVDAGFRDAGHIRKDADLDNVRGEEGYRRVIENLSMPMRRKIEGGPLTEQDPVKRLVEEYIRTPDRPRRLEIAKELEPYDRIAAKEIDSWTTFCFDRIKKRPRCDEGDTKTLKHPAFPIKYRLLGDPTQKKSPLLVYLHGGGPGAATNDGSWESAIRHEAKMYGAFPLIAVPRVWDDVSTVGWAEGSGRESIVAMIEEIQRTYDIDTNRVYLGGCSMGGWGMWYSGCAEADRFAGLFSHPGGFGPTSADLILPNIRNTPTAFVIGDRDTPFQRLESQRLANEKLSELQKTYGGFPFLYKECSGGHTIFPAGVKAINDWLPKQKRNPYPLRVIWSPCDNVFGSSTGNRGGIAERKRYFHWLKMEHPLRGTIDAEIKDGNAIVVKTVGVSEFTIFLNGAMVDLAKPVTVEVDGKPRFSGTVQPSIIALVETIAAKEDPAMFFTSRIHVSLSQEQKK